MNPLERIPTRWLLTGAALACLALWAAPSTAQVTGDPVHGKLLYEDTPTESGNNQLTGSCANSCHGNVDNRRTKIGGSAFADISYVQASAKVSAAIANIGPMNQFNGLDAQQVADIAAYIADTPKVTAAGLSTTNALAFSSSASGVAVTKNLTIHHSLATTANLQITGVALAAGTPTAFTRSSSCNAPRTLMAAGTCTFSVTYTPTSNTAESKALTVSMTQGGVAITRAITLNGSVAGAVTPPPATGGDDSGGGALGWVWLTGLALATVVLARRRRT